MHLIYRLQQIIPALPDSVPDKAQEVKMLKSLPLDELIDRLVNGLVSLAINIAIAILVFYVGKFIINKIYNMVRRVLLNRRVDSGLRTFLLSMIRIVLYFILVVTVIGILGIETSSFLAIFASAGVAIGMALSGTLQNFAGGVLILLLKPYRVGNYIEAQGYAGTVKEIQIFHTVIVTPDNKSIIIPNGGLSTGSVNNYSREKYRRVDWSVGISYGDDVEAARRAILDILAANPAVIKESPAPVVADNATEDDGAEAEETSDTPATAARHKSRWSLRNIFSLHRHKVRRRMNEIRRSRAEAIAEASMPPYSPPVVVLDQLADSAVVLKVRAWVATPDYWTVYHTVNEDIYNAFADGSRGISFPFPQLDVHFPDGPKPSSNNSTDKP